MSGARKLPETRRHASKSPAARSKLSFDTLQRAGIALLGLVSAVVVLQVSIAGAFRGRQPQIALRAAPLDAGARTRLASLYVGLDKTKPLARALAEDAIRRDPTDPEALRVLALSLRGGDRTSHDRVLGMMRQSQRLSRRDGQTQLWFAEDLAERGEYRQMIDHVDIALRSSESGQTGMFALLTAAARDPRGASAIAETVRKRPDWARPFVVYAIGNAPDTAFIIKLAGLVLDPRNPDDRAVYGTLMQRLVDVGDYDLAWRLYGLPGMAPQGSTAMSVRAGGFEKPTLGLPFDWWYSQDAELWASREIAAGGNGFVLRMGASEGRSGDVARQVLHLSPGAHSLRMRMGDLPADDGARPVVRITCGSQSLTMLTAPAAGSGPREVAGKFVVPQACAFQTLHIALAGVEGEQQTPWVDDVRID